MNKLDERFVEIATSDTVTNIVAASTNITAAQCTGRTTISNYNAGATQAGYILPTATVGLHFKCLVSAESGDTGGVKITVGASDVLNESGITTGTGGNVQYTVGGLLIEAICYVANKWTISKSKVKEIAIFGHITTEAGGTATVSALTKRTLDTTVKNNIKGCSLASSQITLPAGTYHIKGYMAFYRANFGECHIYDGTSYVIHGNNAYSGGGDTVNSTSCFDGYVSITSSTTYELRYYCSTTTSTEDLGVSSVSGQPICHALIEIERV